MIINHIECPICEATGEYKGYEECLMHYCPKHKICCSSDYIVNSSAPFSGESCVYCCIEDYKNYDEMAKEDLITGFDIVIKVLYIMYEDIEKIRYNNALNDVKIELFDINNVDFTYHNDNISPFYEPYIRGHNKGLKAKIVKNLERNKIEVDHHIINSIVK